MIYLLQRRKGEKGKGGECDLLRLRGVSRRIVTFFSRMKRATPDPPSPPRAPRHLLLAVDASGKNTEPGAGLKRYAYTPSPSTDWVFDEVLSQYRQTEPSYVEEESHNNFLDVLKYLCNDDWDFERPPEALPGSLWFTPRVELGQWEKLEEHEDFVFVNEGPWLSVIEIMCDFTEDSYELNKQTFDEFLADNIEQERKRKESEEKEKK